jgi:hypothetical protein
LTLTLKGEIANFPGEYKGEKEEGRDDIQVQQKKDGRSMGSGESPEEMVAS